MIRTQGLAYAYAGGTALRFDDVLVPQGGVLLLKGPSGAGKSTWLALAAGLVAPAQGPLDGPQGRPVWSVLPFGGCRHGQVSPVGAQPCGCSLSLLP